MPALCAHALRALLKCAKGSARYACAMVVVSHRLVALVMPVALACNAAPPASGPETMIAIPAVASASSVDAASSDDIAPPSPTASSIASNDDDVPNDAGARAWSYGDDDASFGPYGIGLGGPLGRVDGGSPRAPGGKTVKMKVGPSNVNGRPPPEVIQRIVRQNFGRVRLCYENGLRTNPSLAGRVIIHFVIDRAGAVSSSVDGGSTLRHDPTVQCIARVIHALAFPQPEGGIVTVKYAIDLSFD